MGYRDSLSKIAGEIGIKNSRVLVTGASGLIGSTLIEALLVANVEYMCNNSIFALVRNGASLRERFGNSITYIVQDICTQLPYDYEFNFIFHLASNADPVKYATEPVETILTSVIGTNNVLDYCKMHRACRLLFASSFEVYGKIENTDIYAENQVGVLDFSILRNGYSESKRVSEMLVRSYCDEYGVDGMIARLSSVFGPNMTPSDSKAHAQFIRNGVNGEDIVLKSEGKQKRSYTYVLDAVSALLFLAIKGEKGNVYNVANRNAISTIAELASEVAQISGTNVVFDMPNSFEQKGFSKPQNIVLDTEKIEELGWSGKYDVHFGLTESINYLEKLREK